MKTNLISAVFLFAFIVGGACRADSLEGAWELIDGEYLNDKGEMILYRDTAMQSLKVIADGHFGFTSMKGDQFWASAVGTYRLQEGVYTEVLIYNSFGEKPGAVYSFDYELKGGQWYNSRWKDGKRVEYEVWRRVK